jgi:hypothetical protein
MFNDKYPKSCTIFDIRFEGSFRTGNKSAHIYTGCGTWTDTDWAGVFYTSGVSIIKEFYDDVSLRGSIYVR